MILVIKELFKYQMLLDNSINSQISLLTLSNINISNIHLTEKYETKIKIISNSISPQKTLNSIFILYLMMPILLNSNSTFIGTNIFHNKT